MSELPNGWVNATLDDLGNWSSGGTPSRSRADYFDGEISFVKTGDLEDDWLEEIPERISEAGLQNSSAKLFPKGTLLIAMYGATIGRTARLSVDAATNQACAALLGNEANYDSLDFVWAYLRSQLDNFRAAGKGGAQPNISQTFLKSYPIPLPPLPEQRRIVKKLDTLSARTSTARDHLMAVAKLVERFKLRTLSNEIFREGVPFRKLGDMSSDVRYGTSAKCDYDPTGTPVLRIPNLKQGRIDHEDLKTAHFTEKDLEKLALKIGDVLVIRSNGSPDLVGRVALVTEAETDFIFAGYLIRMRFDEEVALPEYIRLCFQSDEIRGTIEKGLKSTSGVNNINSTELQILEFPMPEVDEQREIVDRIEMAFAKTDRLAEEALKALKLTDNLDQRILAKAFAGELVPQDPNDEPASKLLARIQEARANAPKKPRKKPTKAKPMKVAPQERILTDSAEWPETGLPFEDVANRITLPHDDLKDAVFALLEGDAPKLRQEYDADAQIMKLIRVAS